MKLAIMSDIHSNIVAFEACLAYIKDHPVDGIVMLGDFVSDCPDPELTLDRIYQLQNELPLYLVRGNREEYFIRYRNGLESNWTSSSYKGSLLYTYNRLRSKDLDWFETLPSTKVIQIDGTKPIRLAHGSPFSTRELLDYGKDNTKECLKKLDTEYLLAGHTHRQMTYQFDDKTIINPGSVGVAIGTIKKAHMAYLKWDDEKWNCELMSIPFSYAKVKDWFDHSSLFDMAYIWPTCILKSMEIGENMGPLCAKKAYDLAVSEHALQEDGSVSEVYWDRAARELGII